MTLEPLQISIADAAIHPMLVLDSRFRVRWANRAFVETFKTPNPVVGNSLDQAMRIPPTQSIVLAARLQNTLFGDHEPFKELEIQYPGADDGIERVLLLSGRWIQWHGAPEPESVLVSIEDVTERLRTEHEKETLLKRERAARAEADRANDAKDAFLATLSHELRNPLSAILTWAQMLQTHLADPARMRQGLAVIEENVRHQVRLINDLLDITRIQSGKLHLENTDIDPRSLLKSAIESVRAQAGNKRIALETSLGETRELRLRGDPTRLKQVFSNILSNAVKFSSPSTTVRIGAEVRDRAEGPVLRIEVADRGQGIAPEFLPRLFNRFSQADTSTTRAHDGLGLGLSISRNLVEFHHGTIEVASPGLGKGTTVTVHLPLVERAEQQSPPPSLLPSRRDARTIADLSGIRVLLVDDEPSGRMAHALLLKSLNAEVREAANAEEAARLFSELIPQVVLSDIAMHGEDGYQLVARLRALASGMPGSVKYVALSAYAGAKETEKSIQAGFDAHLTKPIDLQKLADAISDLVTGRRSDAA